MSKINIELIELNKVCIDFTCYLYINTYILYLIMYFVYLLIETNDSVSITSNLKQLE